MKRNNLLDDPFHQLQNWYEQAENDPEVNQPNAMCISTIDKDGFPDSRFVLLKSIDNQGLIFYTNLNSTKGSQLKQIPKIAANLYWKPQSRQIRIKGMVKQISDTKADEYFATRSRRSQLGAWASKQSSELESRDVLSQRLEFYMQKFEDQTVPRPPFWSGFKILPIKFEFWQSGKDRLHDRFVYHQDNDSWIIKQLYP